MLNAIVEFEDFNGALIKVPIFQLLQWKHAVGLEDKGLKFSRGSVTAHVRRIMSIPRKIKREAIVEYLSAILAEVDAQRIAS